MKLLGLALSFAAGSEALSGFDFEVVVGVRLQILDPDGVVVAARVFGAAPGLFGSFIQRVGAVAVLDDAAARGIGGPGISAEVSVTFFTSGPLVMRSACALSCDQAATVNRTNETTRIANVIFLMDRTSPRNGNRVGCEAFEYVATQAELRASLR